MGDNLPARVGSEAKRPRIIQRIIRHGGVGAVHVTPFTNAAQEVVGWQNVIRCMDGTGIGLTPEEERAINAFSEELYAA